jgi:uncharacterized surface protein with fasciclin (FAS1) repeats
MKTKLYLTLSSIAFLCLLAIVTAKANNPPTLNIVETAEKAGNFTILNKALKATGLDETLKSGKFTVFAPTDEAFNALPSGTLDNLLKDKEALKKLLLFHVVEGKMLATDVVGKTELKTVSGETVKIKNLGEKVKIANAKIVKTDILATNGVIHVVNKVMMPKEKSDKDCESKK